MTPFEMEKARVELDEQFIAQASQMQLDVAVLGDGPLDATVAIVGEAPGETEARKRLPFVGSSGILLWNAIGRYGFDHSNVYVTNVVKRQTHFGGDDKLTVPADELDKWIELLEWELSHLPKLKTVLICGNFALRALLGRSGIFNWRGSVISQKLPNGQFGKVVCTINPAYAGREPRVEILFAMDCQRLDLVHRGKWEEYKLETIINPTYKEARSWIRDMRRGKAPVGLDVEHMNNETVCYGLANSGDRAMCINFRDAVTNRYSVREEYDIRNDLQELCESQRIIAQNGGHEIYWCWLRDGIKVKVWMDTLLAHHTLYPQLPHGQGFLTTQYTTHPFYKDEGDVYREGGDIGQFWHYNAKDAGIMWAVHEKELKELKDRELYKFFFEHVMRAQPHIAAATVHGVKVDMAVKERVIQDCEKDVIGLRDEALRLIRECVDDSEFEINLNSWPQMKRLLFDTLGLRGRGTSTDATNRDYIMKDSNTKPLAKEMITALNAYKKEFKFFTTYANSRVSEDGRGRCDYKQYGVVNAPGRLSSSSLISGEGFNMQNIPTRARCQFVTDNDDTVFVYFDGSQAEARVVAYRADIDKWKEQFEKARLDGSYDCHRALCSEMFKMPYEQTPVEDWDEDNRPTKRYIAKRCRHGLNYRMERERLAEVTKLSYHDANRAFILYHKITPELEKWWKEEERGFVKTRTISNAYGRELRVVQRIDDDVKKSIVAFYPQSTVGDWITRAWYMIEEDDEWPAPEYARVCIDVHDNLIAMTTKQHVMRCAKIMKRHAETPLKITNVYGTKTEELIIPAEIKVSYPTVVDRKAETLKFIETPHGLHRWSHMNKVKGV